MRCHRWSGVFVAFMLLSGLGAGTATAQPRSEPAAQGQPGDNGLVNPSTMRLPAVQPVAYFDPPNSDPTTLREVLQRLKAAEAELARLQAQRIQPTALQQSAPNPTADMPDYDLLGQLKEFEKKFNADKNKLPLIRLSGFFQLDAGEFSQDANSRFTLGDVQNGVGFRRARLQALGNLTEFTTYSIEMDFAFPGRPSFMDVWGQQANIPFFGNVRVGQYRQPVTMDSWTNIKHLEFLERSAPFIAFDPFRRVGIMATDTSESERTMWAYGVYGTGWTFWNGTTTTYNTLGNDNRFGTQIGDNGGYAFTMRASHLLYYDDLADGRFLMHVGGGYNFAEIGGNGVGANGAGGGFTGSQTYRASTIPEFFVGDQAGNFSTFAGTPNVLDTGRFLAHNYQLAHAEWAGSYGPAHFQTEYLGTAVSQFNGPMVFYNGAYAQAGYFLTGENVGYNKKMGAMDYNVKPFSDFFALGRKGGFCGWGAWEVAARWSYVDLAARNVNPANYVGVTTFNGALPAGPSPATPNLGSMNESTLALNWWWNQYTRVQFNWIHNMLQSNTRGFSAMDAFTCRYQIEF